MNVHSASAEETAYLSETDAPTTDCTLASEALLLMSAASPCASNPALGAGAGAARPSSHDSSRNSPSGGEEELSPVARRAARQLAIPRLAIPPAEHAHEFFSPINHAQPPRDASAQAWRAGAGADEGPPPFAPAQQQQLSTLLALSTPHASGPWAFQPPPGPWRPQQQWATPRAFPYPPPNSAAVTAFPLIAAAEASASPPREAPGEEAEEASAQWTAAEDQITTEAVERFGCKWNLISSLVPGRTAASVRNRWHRIRRAARRRESESATDGVYKCSRCGAPKKGHMCTLSASDSTRISSARGAMDRLVSAHPAAKEPAPRPHAGHAGRAGHAAPPPGSPAVLGPAAAALANSA